MEKISVILTLFMAATLLPYNEASTLARPKPVMVNCLSQEHNPNFQQRVRYRPNAEDYTTIWLFKGEELHIQFTLPNATTVDVLDVRYSNDGGFDFVTIDVDGTLVGDFKSHSNHDWGKLWNDFHSSGPLGAPQLLAAGNHRLTLKVVDSDYYGIEIDYIRLNVHGPKLGDLQSEHFMCTHNPGKYDHVDTDKYSEQQKNISLQL